MSVVGELVDPVMNVPGAAEYAAVTLATEAGNDAWQTAVGAALPSVRPVHPGMAPPLAWKSTFPAGLTEPAADVTVAMSVTVWPAKGAEEFVCTAVVLGAVIVSVREDCTGSLVPPLLAAVSASAIESPMSALVGVYVTSVAPGIAEQPTGLQRS